MPYSLAGFSFGSRIALQLACNDTGAGRVIAVGFPTTYKNRDYLKDCLTPKLFIQSTRDEHGPMPDLEQVFLTIPEPKKLLWVEAEDHFFKGALDEFEQVIVSLGLS